MKRNIYLDEQKDEIIRLYLKEDKTYKELAILFNTSIHSIATRIRKWGVNNPDGNRHIRKNIPKEVLYKLYWEKEMHPREIGELYGCTLSTVHNYLKKYNIPTRTKSESRMGKLNPIYGVGHTTEARAKMSKAFRSGRKIGTNTCWGRVINYDTPNQGVVTMRSSWEYSTADYLTFNNIDWYYEYKTFKLTDTISYRPDFYLPKLDLYIEVKGVMKKEDLNKINLFKSLHYTIEVWDMPVLVEKGIIDKHGKTDYLRKNKP